MKKIFLIISFILLFFTSCTEKERVLIHNIVVPKVTINGTDHPYVDGVLPSISANYGDIIDLKFSFEKKETAKEEIYKKLLRAMSCDLIVRNGGEGLSFKPTIKHNETITIKVDEWHPNIKIECWVNELNSEDFWGGDSSLLRIYPDQDFINKLESKIPNSLLTDSSMKFNSLTIRNYNSDHGTYHYFYKNENLDELDISFKYVDELDIKEAEILFDYRDISVNSYGEREFLIELFSNLANIDRNLMAEIIEQRCGGMWRTSGFSSGPHETRHETGSSLTIKVSEDSLFCTFGFDYKK